VSRQLWWGHQLPVWYRDDETYVGAEPPPGDGWTRDPDVLDTWFSSALWPFATLGWPRQTPELQAFYPTDVLSTARDIIFLWVARMVMFGVEFTGELPFRDVPIHSVIQAPDGRRMSKSLGTGIDPLDLIDGGPRPPVYKEGGEFPGYGADALRFGLLASSSSQDVRFNEERVRQGRDLANKLWNASRLILVGVQEGVAPSPDHAAAPEDRWILSRLERITARTTESLDAFELSAAALELYDFFWSELCDWYLELAKPRLYDEHADRTAVSATLLFCLDRTLRLLHPLMPHVTEEIWSFLPSADGAERGLLAVAQWPHSDPARIDTQAEELVGRCVAAVTELRRYRDEAGVKPSAVLPARFAADGYDGTAAQVARLARLELRDGSDGEAAAEVPVPGGAVELLATDDFDPGAIAARLGERRDKIAAEIGRLEAKLANERFVERAPADVVQGERDKLSGYRAELERLG
jgi:valyl-tRNA synthetase